MMRFYLICIIVLVDYTMKALFDMHVVVFTCLVDV